MIFTAQKHRVRAKFNNLKTLKPKKAHAFSGLHAAIRRPFTHLASGR
jgi:hypothetical protein